jgi:hypothetical protein
VQDSVICMLDFGAISMTLRIEFGFDWTAWRNSG